ncbi:hypothetical protein ACVIW0_005131 [Bradyrhizobium sp. USDA 4454]
MRAKAGPAASFLSAFERLKVQFVKSTDLDDLFDITQGDDAVVNIENAFCSKELQDPVDMHRAQAKRFR